jgi:hypothetical protein
MVEDKSKIVSFRLSAEEFKEAERIASLASTHGKIRNDSVAILAKACLFVRINEWKQIEFTQETINERDVALKSHNLPTQ